MCLLKRHSTRDLQALSMHDLTRWRGVSTTECCLPRHRQVEAARGGRKLPKSLEQGVMNGGFVLLLMAGAGLVIRDTINLF